MEGGGREREHDGGGSHTHTKKEGGRLVFSFKKRAAAAAAALPSFLSRGSPRRARARRPASLRVKEPGLWTSPGG